MEKVISVFYRTLYYARYVFGTNLDSMHWVSVGFSNHGPLTTDHGPVAIHLISQLVTALFCCRILYKLHRSTNRSESDKEIKMTICYMTEKLLSKLVWLTLCAISVKVSILIQSAFIWKIYTFYLNYKWIHRLFFQSLSFHHYTLRSIDLCKNERGIKTDNTKFICKTILQNPRTGNVISN